MIHLTPPVRRDSAWWSATRNGGLPVRVNARDGQSMTIAAEALDITPVELKALIDAASPSTEGLAPVDEIRAWSTTERRVFDTGTLYDRMSAALDSGLPYIGWSDDSQLAAVDVDVNTPLPSDAIETIAAQGAPGWQWAWMTKSGGLRFIFFAGELPAIALAGVFCAIVHWDSWAAAIDKIELVKITRRPPGTWQAMQREPIADLKGRLLGRGGADAVTAEAIAAYCADHGLEIGGRYPHEKCPADPCWRKGTPPVVVMDDGVYCHRCHAFRSWSALLSPDTPATSGVVLAAHEAVHWEHARYMMDVSMPLCTPQIRRAAYSGMTQLLHEPEKQAKIFHTYEIVRGENVWLDATSLEPRRHITQLSVRALPWVSHSGRADAALDTAPLRGYVPIVPIIGLRRPHASDTGDRIYAPRPVVGACPPVIPPADALAILRDALPGWGDQHDNAIQLLLVGALRAQYAPPLPSTLLLTGDTGSGKSALVSLAAGILGVLSGDIEGGHGTRELGMALGQVCEEGRVFAHVDEIGKIRGFWGESSPLLRLSTHLTWRKLYVGRVTNVNRTMLVLSGSTLPGALPTMAEFARRLPVVDLPRAVADWSAACREKLGCTALSAIRSSSPTSGARIVADALYDWACQQDAREIADWVQYAIDRGAERLTAHDDESLSIAQVLRELYQLWTEGGPEEFFPPSHPRYGRGYLDATQLDQLGGRTKASRLIAPWANAMEWMGFKGRLETAPLNGILGVEAPELRVRITRHNVGEIAIRFGSREGKGKVWKWAYAEKVVTPVTRATAE